MSKRTRSVRIGGLPIYVDDDQPTFWDRVESGAWEVGTIEVLGALLGPGRLFLDVGAWVGPLTLHAAALGAEVVAVEADPAALDGLRRNLAVNPELAARVRVVPGALAPAGGPVRMGARRRPGDSMSSVLLAGRGETWTSPGVTASDLAREFGRDRAALVKIDIEGGEYAVLPTLEPLLARAEALLLALHPDILTEAGAADPTGTARSALAILDGWSCARVGMSESVPASSETAAASGPAEWLFTAPRRAVGGTREP